MESGFSRKSYAPELGGAYRGLDGSVAGNHDDFGSIIQLAYLLQSLQTVHAG